MVEVLKEDFEIDRSEIKYADLQIHTKYSDGKMAPEQVVDFAGETGYINAIAITDHDRISGAFEAKNYAVKNGYNLEVVIGTEVTTLNGHVLGLFIENEIPEGELITQTAARIHEQGGLVVLPHPMLRIIKSTGAFYSLADGFEVFNAGVETFSPAANTLARRFYISQGGKIGAEIATSDSHSYTIGAGLTGYWGDLKEAILKRKTKAFMPEVKDLNFLAELSNKMFPDANRSTVSQRRARKRLERMNYGS